MSVLLEPEHYARVRPLFDGMAYHLAAVTVLVGVAPGTVFVDELDNPQTAILVPSNQHRLYVSGPPQQTMLGDIIQELFTQSGAENHGFVVYYNASHPWQPALERVFPSPESFSGWRQYYRLSGPPAPLSAPLSDQITIGPIDEAIVEDPSLENRELLTEEIVSESPSLNHFFRHNFGFAAQDGHRLVAWCLAEYHYQGRYELGIETIEAYQRRGIAAHLASAVIGHAFAGGATEIGWHCWAQNTPSVATALKLGFGKALDYPVYYGEYGPL